MNKITIHISSLFITLFMLSGSVIAQAPDTLWTKTFGGSDADYGGFVQQTTDGGYIVVGSTHSFGTEFNDIYLIKTDSNGDTIWTKVYADSGLGVGTTVIQTIDGGYIISGYEYDFSLIKTDDVGDILWTKFYGGNDFEWGGFLQITEDDGFIITGDTKSIGAGNRDVYLVKTDDIGDTLWTKIYGGIENDVGGAILETSDGGFLITGYTESFGKGLADVYLIKVDTNGDTLWTKTIGGSDSDYGSLTQQTSDDGFIVVGSTFSFGAGDRDVYLIKTDVNGNTLWTKTFGGSGSEHGSSIQKTLDGGFIICGYTSSFGAGERDVYLIKINEIGDTSWTKIIGGTLDDLGGSVQQTIDGGFIIAGYTLSFGAGSSDLYLIKTGGISNVDNTGLTVKDFDLLQNYRNPFNPSTKIKYQIPELSFVTLKVYDVFGSEIVTLVKEEKPAGSYEVEFEAINLSSGIYFYRLKADNFIETKKMMLLK